MILRALVHVSEERIAVALNVSVAAIRQKRDLLKGICPEAAEILQNERLSAGAFSVLRKELKPVRQIDVARLMMSAMKFSRRFARALLNGTREELLVPPTKSQPRATTGAQQSIMEQETDELLKHVDSIKANYGNDVLDLTASCKYVQRLLANTQVHRYLAKHHEEHLTALEQLLADSDADKQRLPAEQTQSEGRPTAAPETSTVAEGTLSTWSRSILRIEGTLQDLHVGDLDTAGCRSKLDKSTTRKEILSLRAARDRQKPAIRNLLGILRSDTMDSGDRSEHGAGRESERLFGTHDR